MGMLLIDFIDIYGDMKVKYSLDGVGEIITQAFVSKGEANSKLAYYFMPCERTEVKCVVVTTPNEHEEEKNIDQFEEDLRTLHDKHVRFIYF